MAVLEKGSEVGAHILSGAVIDPKGAERADPGLEGKGRAAGDAGHRGPVPVLGPQGDLTSADRSLMPPFMHNHGNYIASLANLCRWLAGEAEALGVEIYPGMAASDLAWHEDGSVKGVVAGVFGIGKDGEKKPDYQPGLELQRQIHLHRRGRARLAGQGAAGEVRPDRGPRAAEVRHRREGDLAGAGRGFQPGPGPAHGRLAAGDDTGGGSFLYHFGDHYVAVGFVVHLNYKNPWLSPFDEFQRLKHHPSIRRYLEGGKRIAYGARAITEGGWQSMPKLTFPGGVLIGCSAGFVNVPRIKGSHNAIKTGMLAAEAAFAAIAAGRGGDELDDYETAYDALLGGQGAEAGAQRQAAAGRASAPWSASVAGACSTCGSTLHRRLLVLRHAEARQDRRRVHRPGQGLQADRLSEARRRDQLRQAVVGVPVLDQPRGGPGPCSGRRHRREAGGFHTHAMRSEHAAPWIMGAPTVLLGNFPTLDNVSKLMCIWGGVIQFITPGEFTVDVP